MALSDEATGGFDRNWTDWTQAGNDYTGNGTGSYLEGGGFGGIGDLSNESGYDTDYFDYGNYGDFSIDNNAYSGMDTSQIDTNYFDPMSDRSQDDEWRRSMYNGVYGSPLGTSTPFSSLGSLLNRSPSAKDTGLFGSTIQQYAKNPLVRALMSMNPYTAVLNAAARGLGDLGGTAGSMVGSALGGPLGSLFGGSAGSGLGQMAAGKDTDMFDFLPSARSLGGLGGAFLGGNLGGANGALLGGMAGSGLGSLFSGGTPNFNPYGGLGGMGDSSTQFGSLLNNSAWGVVPSIVASSKNNKEVSGQINNLNQLFAPNSAYAQQMRQQLERRDAASGRRSQYGNREVELQAKLATLAAQQAPQIDKLYQQKQGNRNLLMQTVLRNPGVQDLIKKGGMSLLDLFSSSGGASPSVTIDPSAYSDFDTSTLPNIIGDSSGWLTGGGW